MTEDVEEALNMDLTDDKLKRSINKSVSFNAIKNLAFDIFATESDTDCIMDQLSKLFLMNTLPVRKEGKLIVIRYFLFDNNWAAYCHSSCKMTSKQTIS
ncbi:hypothetical protein wGmm_1111 [Wolbachia endosymbiont of Glossina morsitans morsitans]|nr:hypothetical protein wGmm_1111 [Wolbachia endosymbiont of Glossina morsitans morsitans]